MHVFCDLCRKVLDVKLPHYHQEIGWTRPRHGGGTNALAMREKTGKLAHKECVELGKARIHLAQGTMF